MSGLTPNLFDRRFSDLVELGRARLRPLAPEWTDHNAHDPGITLMELLAWVAEAQLYSLSRLRRDERRSYAALLGIAPHGTQSASGLIWPDRDNPGSPFNTFLKTVVIPSDTVVNLVGDEGPTFRPQGKLLWVPGRIQRVESRLANGQVVDHTRVNERGGLAFLPFGERATGRDALTIRFETRDQAGLFGANRETAKGARWAVGVIAAPATGGHTVEPGAKRTPLVATLIAEDRRTPLTIAADTTHGLLSTGAILLDLDALSSVPREFAIELRAPNGLPRPPRVMRIEPSVVPIDQGRTVFRELHVSTGMPDWSFVLDVPGLRFAARQEPLVLEVAEPAGMHRWQRRERLVEHGPSENVFAIDTANGEITFGNDVNGRIPPPGAQVFVTYDVSDGLEGRVARNRRWRVAGFEGTFGVNPEPIAGGSDASTWLDDRREARYRSRHEHPLVSSEDIVTAAKEIPLLEVARTWIVPPDVRTPRTGAVTLVAMRHRPGGVEPEGVPETPRWLEAIARRLSPRMPLATRLVVQAPRYVDFAIRAQLEAAQGRDPSAVKAAVEQQLRRRLALVEVEPGVAAREPGVPVSARDVTAWVRAVDGVQRVFEVQLVRDRRRVDGEMTVTRSALPRWRAALSHIDVVRPAARSLR